MPSTKALLQVACDSLMPPDLVLIDRDLPHENGIELTESLRQKGYRGPIFVTAPDADSVFDALDAGATNYLVKGSDVFAKRLGKALHTTRAYMLEDLQGRSIRLKGRDGTHQVPLSQVRYFSVDRHTICGHWGQTVESLEYRSTLDDVQEQFANLGFVRCHRGYVVNTSYIADARQHELTLLSGEQLPVGRRYRAALERLKTFPRTRFG
nr:LytTR family DNA-binding domain-containing protein [uncultured Olegusella sp.]